MMALGIMGLSIFWILKWRQGKPIFHHFKSSSIWKAFLLNAIAASLIIMIALVTKSAYDKYFKDEEARKTQSRGEDPMQNNSQSLNVVSILITLMTTFMASMLAYTLLYVLVGFGGAMIINTT
jgi:uncharacterized membrane protein